MQQNQQTNPNPKRNPKAFQKNQDEFFGSDNNFRLSPTLLSMKVEKDDMVSYQVISKYMKLSQIEQAEETNDVTFKLDYHYLNKKKSIEVTRDQLHPNDLQKLSKKGVDVFYHNVKPIIQYLRIQEDSTPYTTVHTHLGKKQKMNSFTNIREFLGKQHLIPAIKGILISNQKAH
jgi:putative DNA primase/helicase